MFKFNFLRLNALCVWTNEKTWYFSVDMELVNCVETVCTNVLSVENPLRKEYYCSNELFYNFKVCTVYECFIKVAGEEIESNTWMLPQKLLQNSIGTQC